MLSCIVLALLIHQSLSQTLDYVCTTRQEVKILKIGIEAYQWMYASGVRSGLAAQPCDVTEANDTAVGYGIKFIIANCELVTITTAMPDKNIIGGKGAVGFEIKCNGILEGGENVSLVQTVLSKDKGYIQRHQEMAEPRMEIRAKNLTKLADRAIVLIGDELSVLISTSNNFSFSIIACDAHSENQRDRKLLMQNGIPADPSLMTVFNMTKDSKRSNAEARLFAFHFVNSDYLQLTCVIFVCRITDATCKHRQKRNAPSEDDSFSSLTEALEARFVVVDSKESWSFGTSGAKPINSPLFAYLVVVALALLASGGRL